MSNIKKLEQRIEGELAYIKQAFNVEKLHRQWAGPGWREAEEYDARVIGPLREQLLDEKMGLV